MKTKALSFALALAIILSLFTFAAPPASTASAALVATPTASTVLVDGRNVSFDAYNIGGSNYFKLRDLAYTLNGTSKQFAVGYSSASNAITLTSGQSYAVTGGEMTGKGAGNKTPVPTSSKIFLDGRAVAFTAYNIEGNNYFKLRDIGETFNFGVDWDGSINTIAIDTSKGYTPENGKSLTLGDYIAKSSPITSADLLGYFGMTAAERKLYDQWSAAIRNFELEVKIDLISIESVSRVGWILSGTLFDCFWWYGSYNYAYIGDNVYSILPTYCIGDKSVAAIYTSTASVILPAKATVDEGKAWINSTKAALRKAVENIPMQGGLKPYELELAVHEWICANVEYIFDIVEKPWLVRNAYEAIINGRGTCVGHTLAYQYILSLLGIECVYISGANREGVLHAWAAVKLEGDWYHVDISSDSYATQYYSQPNHYFLNLTDKFLTDYGYTIGGSSYPSGINPNVACTATRYYYNGITS